MGEVPDLSTFRQRNRLLRCVQLLRAIVEHDEAVQGTGADSMRSEHYAEAITLIRDDTDQELPPALAWQLAQQAADWIGETGWPYEIVRTETPPPVWLCAALAQHYAARDETPVRDIVETMAMESVGFPSGQVLELLGFRAPSEHPALREDPS